MQRIVVVGASGSGKTTLARKLAKKLDLPYVELDALMHGPNWTERETFVEDARAAADGERWVIDGNYNQALHRYTWERADTLVWVDPPRLQLLRQVLWRTLWRWALRKELWNGNRERARTWFSAEHPIRWGWSQHGRLRQLYPQLLAESSYAHLEVFRLRSRAHAAYFLHDV